MRLEKAWGSDAGPSGEGAGVHTGGREGEEERERKGERTQGWGEEKGGPVEVGTVSAP